jgi:hypothetical protein
MCSETSKAGLGSSGDRVDNGASSPPTVAAELQATARLPASPSVVNDLLAGADVEDSPSVEFLAPEL